MTVDTKRQIPGMQWLPVIFWMTLIFCFSNQANSGAITEAYLGNFNVPLRKIAHLSEYLILCLLSERAFRLSGGSWQRNSLIFAVVLSGFYALTDEWHQAFVPGRSATLSDVLVDLLGALFACAWQVLRRTD